MSNVFERKGFNGQLGFLCIMYGCGILNCRCMIERVTDNLSEKKMVGCYDFSWLVMGIGDMEKYCIYSYGSNNTRVDKCMDAKSCFRDSLAFVELVFLKPD